jgi:hypothetical protein
MTDATAILLAVVLGRPYPPPGVDDTPRNRALRDETAVPWRRSRPAGSWTSPRSNRKPN